VFRFIFDLAQKYLAKMCKTFWRLLIFVYDYINLIKLHKIVIVILNAY